LLDCLSRSTLDADSLNVLKRLVTRAADGSAVVWHRPEATRDAIRVRLRALGEDHFAAYLDAVPAGELTETDSVTGLVSRTSFEAQLDSALLNRSDEALHVVLLEIDRLDSVNEELGHQSGQSLLRLFSERLRAALGAEHLISRLEETRFGVMLSPGMAPRDVSSLVHHVLDLVQRPYLIRGEVSTIQASAGIAVAPADGKGAKDVIKAAELAVGEARQQTGLRCTSFHISMRRAAEARRLSELELRRALALRQFELYYQPQVDVHGKLAGFEALIRWKHPQRGIIPPLDFLPVAERIGAIVPIGEWVLKTACKEAVNWPEDIVVAVNASPVQIEHGGFADAVRAALRLTGLPGKRLEVEITEGLLMGRTDAVLRTLSELRAMNVRIAMDDFGTGYASLSQLACFPFDTIKIDRSLAGFEGDDPKKRAIVRAITMLAESLGACSLAEGVETLEQLKRLRRDGCEMLQGYYFGRPVPASDLPDVIARLSQSAGTPQEE
jgi:diguanylate cyclase (GGDEF)-like protein